MKPFPKGAGVVCPVRDTNLAGESWQDSSGGQHNIWQDANIKFVVIRDHWALVEPSDGTYDWSYLDLGVSLSQQYNKPIVMGVNGAQYPQWLANEGVPIWRSSTGRTCPYPWNNLCSSRWYNMVKLMGARYDNYPLLYGLTLWGGGTEVECFFAQSNADCLALDTIAGGGTGSGALFWENASKGLIRDQINNFPTTAAFLATGQNYSNDNNASMTDEANWFLNLYPGQNGLQSNGLSQNFPAPSGGKFPHTAIQCSSISIIMYQYVNPVPIPGPPTNTQIMQNGFNHNCWSVQCYPQDPNQDNEAGVLWLNSALGV